MTNKIRKKIKKEAEYSATEYAAVAPARHNDSWSFEKGFIAGAKYALKLVGWQPISSMPDNELVLLGLWVNHNGVQESHQEFYLARYDYEDQCLYDVGFEANLPWEKEEIEKRIQEDKFDPVTKPKHYNSHPSGIQCIQITEHLNFCVGNAIKYLWRSDLKNGIEDLEKAKWYIEREIQRRKCEKQNA